MRGRNNQSGKILLLFVACLVLTALLIGKNGRKAQDKNNDIISETKDENEQTHSDKPKMSTEEETIRVLLKTSDFKSIFHDNVKIISKTAMNVTVGDLKREIPANVELNLNSLLDAYEKMTVKQQLETSDIHILFKPSQISNERIQITSIERNQGVPSYRGNLEIIKTGNGYVIVNELPVEEYLYSVVTSEMPSDYPKEALKAQAVCARSYAMRQMQNPAYQEYNAHVDDSSGYQVYNNVAETMAATGAVQETRGEVVLYHGQIASTYYFSTSCGLTTNDEVWRNEYGKTADSKPYLCSKNISSRETVEAFQILDETKSDLTTEEGFHAYIISMKQDDYESTEPWYRWKLSFAPKQLSDLREKMIERAEVNQNLILYKTENGYVNGVPDSLSELTDVQIIHRNDGGLIDEVLLCFGENQIRILTEYNIRYILSPNDALITKLDGSTAVCGKLLPSAYFSMNLKRNESDGILEEILLNGGGYGHGVGMSQNGAKNMAYAGKTYADILNFFYQDTVVEEIYE